mmetsp:Transcript_4820/g.12716  ORF Transcript_4820/g.12716 Transcript_4820/m.12716 type:complete len:219 (+) Transcript_4820:284-940(+)
MLLGMLPRRCCCSTTGVSGRALLAVCAWDGAQDADLALVLLLVAGCPTYVRAKCSVRETGCRGGVNAFAARPVRTQQRRSWEQWPGRRGLWSMWTPLVRLWLSQRRRRSFLPRCGKAAGRRRSSRQLIDGETSSLLFPTHTHVRLCALCCVLTSPSPRPCPPLPRAGWCTSTRPRRRSRGANSARSGARSAGRTATTALCAAASARICRPAPSPASAV